MTVRISSIDHDRLIALAQGAAEEVCGLLLGAGDRIDALLPAANVAGDPRTRFEIDPEVLLAAHRAARGGGPGVIGCYHSHPGGRAEPSATDAAQAAADGRLWLIVGDGRVTAWRAVAGGGRFGRFDPMPLSIMTSRRLR